MTDQIKDALKAMNRRPVAYNPVYAVLTGSVTGGILLSQLIYWAAAMDWKEFYKTNPDIIKETGLTEDELRLAKKRLVKYVEIVKKGTPCRTWYRLDIDKILANISSTGETPQLDAGKPRNQYRGNPATIYTENNTETTTDIKGVGAAPGNPGKEKKKQEVPESVIRKLIDAFRDVNPAYEDFFKNTTQRSAVKWLVEKYGEEGALKKIQFLKTHNATKFAGKAITSPHELKRDMGKIEAFWQKEKSEKQLPTKARTAKGEKIILTPEGYINADTGVKVEDAPLSEEEYNRQRNLRWAELTKACGKCRDGYLMTDTGGAYCSCVKELLT